MAHQVMAVLEAHVEQERWAELSDGYAQLGTQRPPQLVESFLLQSTTDQTLWRVVSIWHDRQALADYRASVSTPAAVLLFQSVGVEPGLAIFEIMDR